MNILAYAHRVFGTFGLKVLLLAIPCLSYGQYTWSVSPGAVIPTENAADTELIVENAPSAHFNIDFDTGGAPRLVGLNLENTLSVAFDFSFSRSWGSGGFSFAYEATYRVHLLPTNNLDVWIVAIDYKTKAWGWSRSGTVYLWKVDKNNPTTPVSTGSSDVGEVPPVGTEPEEDANTNGWEDQFDWDYFVEWYSVPDGEVTMPDPIFIDSYDEGDYDGWFDFDYEFGDEIDTVSEG